MTSTSDSGNGHGTQGSPQTTIEETIYPAKVEANEKNMADPSPTYVPSPKHEPGYGWGSGNPIKTKEEGQELLKTAYSEGKQYYNITGDGKIVKFQPDNTPGNGYHSYEVANPKDIPANILKKMLNEGRITRSEYNKFRKGKK